ncbi:hypothetical protein [Hymenobacter terricola]|uniref:hypothetical protein n=1 Tax=Hymenobacter terricola TaxID=2819236 RepID=UPI001B314ACF|nr:hypothetical protein [Hymenobacter terricola]
MESRFEMLLPNMRKNRRTAIVFGGLYAAVWVAWVASMVHRLGFSSGMQWALSLLMLAAMIGLVFLPWLIRKLAYEPHLLVVANSELRVENQQSGEARHFPFENIAKFRVNIFRGSVGLWFWSHEGKKQALNSNNDDLLRAVPALKQALRQYEQAHGELAKFRPVSCFGHPVSTAFLWLYVALLLGLARIVMQQSETSGATGFLWMLGLGFVPYALGWYEAREERQNY